MVADSYYVDDATRRYLRKNGYLYLVSISKQRFKEVWNACSKHVTSCGDWIIMYSKEEKEYAMMYWTKDLGQKLVLTNAFTHSLNPLRHRKREPTRNKIWYLYEFLFNGDDRFNHFLNNKYWPYKRQGWSSNYDKFYFAALAMDMYAMGHELKGYYEGKYIDFQEFCKDLAHSI